MAAEGEASTEQLTRKFTDWLKSQLEPDPRRIPLDKLYFRRGDYEVAYTLAEVRYVQQQHTEQLQQQQQALQQHTQQLQQLNRKLDGLMLGGLAALGLLLYDRRSGSRGSGRT
ncbi:hypothetical protein ABPG75_001135 [Micractinium tetrahymenae]